MTSPPVVSGRGRDPFGWVKRRTDEHRRQHHCWAYPYHDGSVLGAIADDLGAQDVLEMGTALGYSACWWAAHSRHVDSIELDPVHVELARANLEYAGLADRVTVHPGDFRDVATTLDRRYDIAFFDGYDLPDWLIPRFRDLLRPDGTMVLTNLDLGGDHRAALQTAEGWHTDIRGDLAVMRRS